MSLNKYRQFKKRNKNNILGTPDVIHFSFLSPSILKKTVIQILVIDNSTKPNTCFNQTVDIFQETARFGDSFTVIKQK